MSIFSPPNSLITVCTRVPRCPTHEPIGSILASLAATAILVRLPASREMALMATAPEAISGTSKVNNCRTISGCARETKTSGPLAAALTATKKTRSRCPGV